MLDRLDEIEYPYYFQFTLNAYGRDVEPHLPCKNDFLIPAFQRLSQKIGRERVVWRYDPIFFSEKYTMDYHCHYFEQLAIRLHPFTEKCTVSFLDIYRNTRNNMNSHHIRGLSLQEMRELMERLAMIASKYGLYIDTCAEEIDLKEFGIGHACCIDKNRLKKVSGYRLNLEKDRNQRKKCGCTSSIDIGMYHTCAHGCQYCYANSNPKLAEQNLRRHRSTSSLLLGGLCEKDVVKERRVSSCRTGQLSLF